MGTKIKKYNKSLKSSYIKIKKELKETCNEFMNKKSYYKTYNSEKVSRIKS